MLEEDKYLDIREKLQSLPQVKAGDDFVNSLQRKINLLDVDTGAALHKKNVKKLEESFFSRLFGRSQNPWLVPAAGFGVVLLLVFTWVFMNTGNNDMTSTNQTAQDLKQPGQTETQNNSTGTTESNEKSGDNNTGKDIAGADLTTQSPDVSSTIERDNVSSDRNLTAPVKTIEPTDNVETKVSNTDGLVSPESRTPAVSDEKKNVLVEPATENEKKERSAMPKKEESESKDDDVQGGNKLSKRSLRTATVIDKSGLESLQEKVQESK